VNDDVAGCENVSASIIKSEAVATDIASNCGDASGGHLGKAVFAEITAQPVEHVVFQNLSGDALFNSGTAARANQQHDLAIGHRAQQTLKKVGPKETGGAGDEQPLAGQCVTNHK